MLQSSPREQVFNQREEELSVALHILSGDTLKQLLNSET